MLTEQRYEIILELLETRKSVTVTELKEILDTSESTVRRDITALDKMGRLTKVFGGAVSLENAVSAYEPTVAQKSDLNIEEKKKIAREKAGQLFPKFGLDGTQNKYPSQLSGGMRQRAAFLRTYLFSNEINLLDEPFSALDAITKGELHKWYLDIVNSINLSSIIITHDIDEAIMLSDRIYVMGGRPGSIVSTINIEKDKNQRKNYNLTEEFLEYKKEILSKLM